MPTSYQAPMRGDRPFPDTPVRTSSQTTDSLAGAGAGTVRHLLADKGGAVHAIAPEDTLTTAVVRLRDNRIGALAVVDAAGALAGILSERDIVRKLAETPGQTLPQTVAENMTSRVVTCAPDDLLIDVLRQMTQGGFRHMPALEAGRLVGMVTLGDVVGHRLREVEHRALQLEQLIVG